MADEEAGAPSVDDFPSLRHSSQALNAVSFGFIATAVLFAMFLVMAIFERILRPYRAARTGARDEERGDGNTGTAAEHLKELTLSARYANAILVIIPGEDHPTHFAVPVSTHSKLDVSPKGEVFEAENVSEKGKDISEDLEEQRGHSFASTSSSHLKIPRSDADDEGECSSRREMEVMETPARIHQRTDSEAISEPGP